MNFSNSELLFTGNVSFILTFFAHVLSVIQSNCFKVWNLTISLPGWAFSCFVSSCVDVCVFISIVMDPDINYDDSDISWLTQKPSQDKGDDYEIYDGSSSEK